MRVFYAYARSDAAARASLHKHLVSLRLSHSIEEWFDGQIEPGEEWDSVIREQLEMADIVLLLISVEFLNSTYAAGVEMQRALQRHADGEAHVIPIFLHPVHLREHPLLRLQGLPRNGVPISHWSSEEDGYVSVAEALDDLVSQLTKNQKVKPKPISVPDALTRIPRPPVVNYVRRKDALDRDLVEYLVAELAPQKQQLIAIWGAGGVGKTTIAAEVARALVNPFEGFISWISSDGRDDLTFDAILEDIALQLSCDTPHSGDQRIERAELVARFLSTRPALLVLDNFETIQTDEQKRCLDWLSLKARCPTLITGRENVARARNIPLGAMREPEVEAYLAGLAEQSQFSLDTSTLGADEIVSVSGANPLVLQWILGQVNLAKDPSEVIDELKRGEGDAAKRVFDRSFNLPQTGEDGRAVLVAHSLFPASASRAALTFVAGFDSDQARASQAISRLANLRLVELANDPSRLRIQGSLTREHAHAKLLKRHDEREFRERYVSYFVSLCDKHSDPTPWNYEALELELANVGKAVALAVSFEDAEAVYSISGTVAASATGVFVVRGRWPEAAEMNKSALHLARKTGDEKAVQFFGHNLGAIWASHNELRKARVPLRESLTAAEANQSLYFAAATMFELANLDYKEFDLDSAKNRYLRSLEMAAANGNMAVIANCLHQLGLLEIRFGNLKEARRLLLESLKIKQSQPESISLALTLQELGAVAEVSGDLSEAGRAYEFALAILKRFRSPLADIVERDLSRVHRSDERKNIQ